MPLDTKQINRIQQKYARRVEEIRRDRTLSDYGRAREMLLARHQAEREMQQLTEREARDRADRRRKLESRLFSIQDMPDKTAAAISLRDAMDRVADIDTPAEAERMLRRAIRSGDHILARAVVDRAAEMSKTPLASTEWDRVVGAYVEQLRPDLRGAYEELKGLQAEDTPRARLTRQMATGLAVPPEVAALGPADQRQILTEAENGGSPAA